MEPVCAREHGDLVAHFDSVHTNRTLGSFASEHFRVGPLLGKSTDDVLSSRGSRSAVPILLYQFGYDPV
jgi:hypothetical protein